MGYYVHLSVCFSCDRNEPVAELAKKHLALLPADPVEAHWFLEDLSKRTGENPGPKGGLSMWGITGNYTRGGEFVQALGPFWEEMLRSDAGPLIFEHILVFFEPEQSERAQAFEIFLKTGEDCDGSNESYGPLVIKHHENLPFCWMQM